MMFFAGNEGCLFCFADDKFYADSYGSGLLLRGVLLHFLRRFDEAHQAFDEILDMFVSSTSKGLFLFTSASF